MPFSVFIDRDGTLNDDSGYVGNPSGVVLIEGAAAAIKRLNKAGVKAVVVSNQSGVARGKFTLQDAEAVNKKLIELLAAEGARLDGIYFCPHHPDDGCGCRKPKTGLVVKAAKELGLDVGRSYVVGDKASDIELARNLGPSVKAALVLTGSGEAERGRLSFQPEFTASDIFQAIEWLIADVRRRKAVNRES
ncbi:MAG: HAD family hydrolase [Deltaproteobacteria bacterium]|nr:HAD family hydrolase [Deltaproteobacteria bacterium]